MSRRGWLLFVAASVIWGIPYLLIKVAVRHVEPSVVVFGRTAIGAVVLLPVAIGRRQIRPVLAEWRWLLAYVAVEIAGPWVLLSDAERKLPSSLSGLLVSAVPLVGAVLVWLTPGSERLTRLRLLGLVVGISGVAMLLGLDVHGATAWPVVEVGFVAVGYALGPWIAAHRLSHVPLLGMVSMSLGLCAIVYLPVAVAQAPASAPGARVTASIVTLGVVCSALGFVVFLGLIAETGPHRATLITYVNPAVAVVLGVVFLGEGFGVSTAAGFVLILAGCALATRRGRQAGEPPELAASPGVPYQPSPD